MARFLFTVFKGFVIVGGIVLVFMILSTINGNSSGAKAVSALSGQTACLKVQAGVFHVVDGELKTTVLPKGSQVVVLGSADEHGDVDMTIPAKAFRYRGAIYTASSSFLGDCH